MKDWLQQFENALRVRMRNHTQQAYLRDVRRLLQLTGTPPEQWDSQTIQQALLKLHSQGLAPRSLHRILSSWRYFFRYLNEHSDVFEPLLSLSVKLPKIAHVLPQTLSPDEAHHILDHSMLAVQNKESADKEVHLGAYVLAELLYAAGLRIHEAAQLRWRDIDFPVENIRVYGKGGRMRDVPLGSKAFQALQQWKHSSLYQEPDAFVFSNAQGKAFSIRTLQRWIRDLGRKTDSKRRLYPHLFRHSFASHLLQSSGDLRAVQEMLGHTSLQATQVYTHLDFQHLSKVYDEAHPRAQKKTQEKFEAFTFLSSKDKKADTE